MNMLAGPNQSGVYTVSINPSVATHVITQPSGVPVPPLSIITQPNQQIAQRRMPQIMQAGQVVNLSSPVRTTTQVTKPYTCTHCQKTLSSRYNVVRHEKICKSNTAAQNLQQDQPQLPQSQQPHQQQPAHQQQMDVKNPFQCYFCHKTGFSSQESVSKHQKKCKNNPSNQVQREHHEHGRRVHICKYCAKEFSTKWNVIRHERLFHSPNDPIIVPQSVANGLAVTVAPVAPVGKPERYCRFCGNYFSSKYNAIRHEKICTRINDNSSSQEQSVSIQKPIQVTSNPSTVQSMTLTLPTTEQHQVINQQQLLQQQLSQQQPQQQLQQAQANIQTHQQQQQNNLQPQQQQQQRQQVIPQQTMVLIEPHSTPYHVCKYCNKQFSTRCEPIGLTNPGLPNGQTVATVTGQHMQLPICSSTGPLGLVTPVMASLPQVAFVQPPLQQLHQTQAMIQHQQSHLQQEKLQGTQQNHQHTQQINIQHLNIQQQPRIQQQQQQQQQQHIRQQLQPTQQQQQQQHHQQQEPPQSAQQTERPHACKYCEKHFATKWYLDQHEKIHTGEADMCKQCGKYFVTRWHLDKHMRVHMSGGSNSSKRAKKETESPSTATMQTNPANSLVRQVPAIEFPQQILVEPPSTSIRQIISSTSTVTVSSVAEQATTRVVSASYPHPTDGTQVFLQTMSQQMPQENPGVNVSRENNEQHSNQDNKNQQHPHPMSISYS